MEVSCEELLDEARDDYIDRIINTKLTFKDEIIKYFTMINYKIKNFIYSIKKLIVWIPIIWKDRDWDHYYFYKILATKLVSMENHHIYKELKICRILAERIYKDDYSDYEMQKLDIDYLCLLIKKHSLKWWD